MHTRTTADAPNPTGGGGDGNEVAAHIPWMLHGTMHVCDSIATKSASERRKRIYYDHWGLLASALVVKTYYFTGECSGHASTPDVSPTNWNRALSQGRRRKVVYWRFLVP